MEFIEPRGCPYIGHRPIHNARTRFHNTCGFCERGLRQYYADRQHGELSGHRNHTEHSDHGCAHPPQIHRHGCISGRPHSYTRPANEMTCDFRGCRRFAMVICGTCLLSGILGVPAKARPILDTEVKVNLASQHLSTALAELAKQADVRIYSSITASEDVSTHQLRGRMSLREALVRLLSDTHFGASETSIRTIDITVDLNSLGSASDSGSTSPTPAIEVVTPVLADTTSLSELLVISQYDNGYVATTTSGATRIDTDLMDVPQAVNVVTRQLLDDQQTQTLAEAVSNSSGVQSINSSSVEFGQTFVFRGFTLFTGGVMENGLSAQSSGYSSTTPIWGLDSVEVLKGAEAILAGANASYGGVVNLITKQPQATPMAAMNVNYGTYGIANVGWDSAGALMDNADLTYRMVAQITRSGGTGAGYDANHSGYYLAPSLRWNTLDSTVLVGVEREVIDGPLPPIALVPAGASSFSNSNPIRAFGALDDGFVDYSTRTYYEFNQVLFASPWSFRSRGQYKSEEIVTDAWQFYNFAADAAGNGSGGYFPGLSDVHARTYTLQNDVQGTLSVGGQKHEILVGADYTKFGDDYAFNYVLPTANYNIYNSPPLPPVHDLVAPGPLIPLNAVAEIGYLFEDQIGWGAWRAQIAVRDALYHSYGVSPDTQHWLPNYALTYKITDDISVYANSMQGYAPRLGVLTSPGTYAPPETARSNEIGAKLDFFKRTLSLTADVFRIRINETPYLSLANPEFAYMGPGETSTGEEFEFHGNVSANFAVSFAYTTMSAQGVGAPILGVAHNTANVWIRYHFERALLQHYSIGLRMDARSAAINQDTDSGAYFRNPGNVSTDVHLGYTRDRVSIDLGIRDVFDRRIYDRYQLDSPSVVLDAVGTTFLLSGKYQLW